MHTHDFCRRKTFQKKESTSDEQLTAGIIIVKSKALKGLLRFRNRDSHASPIKNVSNWLEALEIPSLNAQMYT
uniref:Type II toxin-antitoxin system VapC family toxin n=1 Tax=Panagrellus redivivus TaxID=6233 RepID=A0A7E4V3J3_PANRE